MNRHELTVNKDYGRLSADVDVVQQNNGPFGWSYQLIHAKCHGGQHQFEDLRKDLFGSMAQDLGKYVA